MNEVATRSNVYEFTSDWFSMRIPTFEKFLAPLVGSPCNILEVGCYEGRSTTWLVDNILTHPDSHLDAIDFHPNEIFDQNIINTGRSGQVNFHCGFSHDVLRTLALDTYDFIYVDASHSTVRVLEDAVLSFRLAKIGAVIGFDDYLWDAPPYNDEGIPKPALDAFLELYGNSPRYEPLIERLPINDDWQVWVKKIRSPQNHDYAL